MHRPIFSNCSSATDSRALFYTGSTRGDSRRRPLGHGSEAPGQGSQRRRHDDRSPDLRHDLAVELAGDVA